MQNLNLNKIQKNELAVIVNKWSNIEGDYSTTLLQGIAHFKCDSGIMSDAYSKADVEYMLTNMKQYFDEHGIETDAFYEVLNEHEANLQFVNCSYELYKFSEKHNVDDEDVYSLASEMEAELLAFQLIIGVDKTDSGCYNVYNN